MHLVPPLLAIGIIPKLSNAYIARRCDAIRAERGSMDTNVEKKKRDWRRESYRRTTL